MKDVNLIPEESSDTIGRHIYLFSYKYIHFLH